MTPTSAPEPSRKIELPELPHWTPLGDTRCVDDFYTVCLTPEQTRILNDNLLRLTSWAKQCEDIHVE